MLVNISLRKRLLAKFILLLNLFFQESWPRFRRCDSTLSLSTFSILVSTFIVC